MLLLAFYHSCKYQRILHGFVGAGTSQLGPCYLRGKLGHYRTVCPLAMVASDGPDLGSGIMTSVVVGLASEASDSQTFG